MLKRQSAKVSTCVSANFLGIIPGDDYLAGATCRGELAVLNPESPTGLEYRNTARRLLGEEVPFMVKKAKERTANDDLCIENP